MLTTTDARTAPSTWVGSSGDAEFVVMVREARLSTPPGLVIPDLAGALGDAVTGEPETRCRNTTYFDTADLRLADAGITVRRDRDSSGYDWTLVLTTDPGAPFPVRQRMRYADRGHTVPEPLARYLRNHHHPVGIRPQSCVSGHADVLPLQMPGVHLRIGEIVNEVLEPRAMSGRVRTLRQLTVVAFDLDGVGRRMLEGATSRLLGAGCRLELVTGDLYRFVDPLAINGSFVG